MSTQWPTPATGIVQRRLSTEQRSCNLRQSPVETSPLIREAIAFRVVALLLNACGLLHQWSRLTVVPAVSLPMSSHIHRGAEATRVDSHSAGQLTGAHTRRYTMAPGTCR